MKVPPRTTRPAPRRRKRFRWFAKVSPPTTKHRSPSAKVPPSSTKCPDAKTERRARRRKSPLRARGLASGTRSARHAHEAHTPSTDGYAAVHEPWAAVTQGSSSESRTLAFATKASAGGTEAFAVRADPASNVEGARARLDAYFLSGALGDAVGADMHALYKFVTALEAGCAWEAPARFDELSGEQQSVIVANESFSGEGRIWLRQIDPQR